MKLRFIHYAQFALGLIIAGAQSYVPVGVDEASLVRIVSTIAGIALASLATFSRPITETKSLPAPAPVVAQVVRANDTRAGAP